MTQAVGLPAEQHKLELIRRWRLPRSVWEYIGLISISTIGIYLLNQKLELTHVFIITIEMVCAFLWDLPGVLAPFGIDSALEILTCTCSGCQYIGLNLRDSVQFVMYKILTRDKAEKAKKYKLRELRDEMSVLKFQVMFHTPAVFNLALNIVAAYHVFLSLKLNNFSLVSSGGADRSVQRFVWIVLALIPRLVAVVLSTNILLRGNEKHFTNSWKKMRTFHVEEPADEVRGCDEARLGDGRPSPDRRQPFPQIQQKSRRLPDIGPVEVQVPQESVVNRTTEDRAFIDDEDHRDT